MPVTPPDIDKINSIKGNLNRLTNVIQYNNDSNSNFINNLTNNINDLSSLVESLISYCDDKNSELKESLDIIDNANDRIRGLIDRLNDIDSNDSISEDSFSTANENTPEINRLQKEIQEAIRERDQANDNINSLNSELTNIDLIIGNLMPLIDTNKNKDLYKNIMNRIDSIKNRINNYLNPNQNPYGGRRKRSGKRMTKKFKRTMKKYIKKPAMRGGYIAAYGKDYIEGKYTSRPKKKRRHTANYNTRRKKRRYTTTTTSSRS